jgi:DNA-binding transcriptional MerR regulator
MMWTIPGTVLHADRSEATHIPQQLEALFFGGGITLSQVTSITGLEAYTVQNWVKRGFLSPPKNKRYTLQQLCRILHINMLKDVMPLERICSLLRYINGKLDQEDDDIIDDAALYFLFVRLAARAKQLDDPAVWKQAMEEALCNYQEPVPGARERIEKALRIMLIGNVACKMAQTAERMLDEL